MTFDVNVISTGSRGNAVLLDGRYLFDCGVPFCKIKPYLKELRLVFLTHIHSDHFNSRTVHEIHKRRPSVKFVCGRNMLVPLVTGAGVSPAQIRVLDEASPSVYHTFPDGEQAVYRPFPLVHNVENYGWLFSILEGDGRKSALYATDTHHIPIAAPGLELYLVESNYREGDLERRRARKAREGKFSYEDTVAASHMSHETVTAWLAENADAHSQVVFLHQHIEKEAGNGKTEPIHLL